ncbi:hypothetical protein DFH09DRAFT_273589 [Mycena vulgaris]|nr:hypothetical protein DFH09DRAFT_273589 [Mycena vulgaris]
MHFLMLFPEVLCEILHGMLLQDIMNATRTSSHLRNMSLTFREVWANAQDCRDIPFPLGESMDSVETAVLPRLACRAIALQKKWKEKILAPVRWSRQTFSHIPSWDRWMTTARLGFPSPEWFYLLPGGQSFLLAKRWAVGIYDLRGRNGHRFDFDGGVVALDYTDTVNGESLTVGLILCENARLCSPKLALFHLETIEASAPLVLAPKYINLPPDSQGLSMKHSTALIWGPHFLFLHDLNTGLSVHVSSTMESSIGYASIHPSLPLRVVVFSTTDQTRTLSVVDNIRDAMTDVTLKDGSQPRQFTPRVLETVRIFEPTHRLRNPLNFCLRVDADSLAILDMRASMACIEHPMTATSLNPPIAPGHYHLWPCPTPCGRLFMFVLRHKSVDLFQSVSGGVEHLGTLDPRTTEFITNFYHAPSLKVAFDPVHGTLLLEGEGEVLVVQY